MFILRYIIALLIFFAIDMVWLGLIARNFYQKHIGFLMTDNVNWIAALFFYFLFIGGLLVFIIEPALQKNSWTTALLYGAFFGLVTYATYDLTNLATLKNWPLIVTVVDLIWGMVLASSVSTIAFFIIKKLGL